MALPWQRMVYKTFVDENEVARLIEAQALESGIYGLPAEPKYPAGADKSQRDAIDQAVRRKIHEGPTDNDGGGQAWRACADSANAWGGVGDLCCGGNPIRMGYHAERRPASYPAPARFCVTMSARLVLASSRGHGSASALVSVLMTSEIKLRGLQNNRTNICEETSESGGRVVNSQKEIEKSEDIIEPFILPESHSIKRCVLNNLPFFACPLRASPIGKRPNRTLSQRSLWMGPT
jgi:hypothetical protein